MGELIGYKVLTEHRRSLLTPLYRGGKIYIKNIKVTPENGYGPLCIFKSYETAACFRTMWCATTNINIIVKCKYIESIKSQIHMRFQTNGPEKIDLPRGTVLADSVICLE